MVMIYPLVVCAPDNARAFRIVYRYGVWAVSCYRPRLWAGCARAEYPQGWGAVCGVGGVSAGLGAFAGANAPHVFPEQSSPGRACLAGLA